MTRLKFLGIFCIIALLIPANLSAQGRNNLLDDVGSHLDVFMPELESGSIIIGEGPEPPAEPNILKITFLKIPPTSSIEGRIENLLHGIKTDIPPEYDHYGYEIRRYMSRIGNVKIFEDEEFLVEQIKNVRKARVIIEYWQAALQKEVNEIEEIVDNMPDAPSIIKTSLRKNKAEARSFITDAQRWIDSNERYLQHVYNLFGYLNLYYPELAFMRPHERIDFFNLLTTKQSILKRIKEYGPFAHMVY
ncbi:MAG: hypothetical protein OEY94_05030 [Alphaproteobacteria bacterium]|nr:hypothetical protein [Alphaproteobacteria bacterium]